MRLCCVSFLALTFVFVCTVLVLVGPRLFPDVVYDREATTPRSRQLLAVCQPQDKIHTANTFRIRWIIHDQCTVDSPTTTDLDALMAIPSNQTVNYNVLPICSLLGYGACLNDEQLEQCVFGYYVALIWLWVVIPSAGAAFVILTFWW